MADHLIKNIRMGLSENVESTFNQASGWFQVQTIDVGTNELTVTGHGFTEDVTEVRLLGPNVPTGTDTVTTYEVDVVDANTIILASASPAASNPVDITADNGDFSLYVYPTGIAGGTEYHRFVTSARNFYIPSAEKFDDRGKIGLGTDLPNIRETGYLNPVSLDITDSLDVHIHAMLLKRGCGDTSVSTANPFAGEYTHDFVVEPTVTQLPSSTLVWGVGGADYYWYGMTVESFQVEGTRSDQPTFTATLVGTGKHGAVSVYGNPTMKSYVTPEYMKGAETQISYDNSGTVQLADRVSGTQRILSWSVSVANNNINDDKRPGDKRIDPANPLSGHYVDRMLSGDREVAGECVITVDTAMQEVADSLADTIYSDFAIVANGGFITPLTPNLQYGTTFNFPKCYISTEEALDDNGLAAIRMTIFPVYDDTALTSLEVQVRNNRTTLV